MSRHQRMKKTLRSPARKAHQRHNRTYRRITQLITEHFADGHVHADGRCPRDGAS